jgi:hypothetical protein
MTSGRMKWVGYIVCMGEIRNVYKILIGKPEGKRPLGRHIRTNLSEIGWKGVDWMYLAQDRDQ